MNIVPIDYEKLAEEIAKKMAKAPPPEKVIWTSEDCATYLGHTKKYFVDCICKQFGFPQPVPLGGQSSSIKQSHHARWLAVDIQQWAVDGKINRKAS